MIVPFDNDFEETMRDLNLFSSELMKIIENELERLLRDMEIDRIGDPMDENRQRFEFDGKAPGSPFNLNESLDPIEPLRPPRPTPKPKRPFEIPRKALAEMAEPLLDVFDNEGTFEVYIQLPGAEKKDVSIKMRDGRIEVKSGNLRKVIELPTKEAVSHVTSSDYRNGVLKIVIPKRFRLRHDDAHRAKMV